MKVNRNYSNLAESYLFSTISRKVAEFKESHPEREIIRLGIGDVTLPLCKPVVDALVAASAEQGDPSAFHGYGPEQGYDFLKRAIVEHYHTFGVMVEPDEIFVSDGAKSDLGNILDLFDTDNTVLIPDPVYPVYCDTNLMAGRRIIYMNATKENGFLPMPDESVKADIIYLCSPNNPTGAVYTREQLQEWVDYAVRQDAVILFDAAYEAFVQGELPHSIYEVPGARDCAIEFCSFSKTAGFTGTRCGYTVVPVNLTRGGMSLNKMWLRRILSGSESGRGRLHTGRDERLHGASCRLSAERQTHFRNPHPAGHLAHRRKELPVHLAGVPERDGFLGVF